MQKTKQWQNSTMIQQPMKPLYANDIIDVLPLSRFWRLYFFQKKLVRKDRYGTLCNISNPGFDTLSCQKFKI